MYSTDPSWIPGIMDEISKCDNLVKKACYGEEEFLKCNSYNIQLCGYREFPSANIPCMLAHIMADGADRLAGKMYIVTSDSSFVPALEILARWNIETVVIGSGKADKLLKCSADRFMYAEVLAGRECTADITDIKDIVKEIKSVSSYYKGMGKDITVSDVCDALIRKHSDFDPRNYGYTHMETLIKEHVANMKIDYSGGKAVLSIIDDREDVEKYIYSYMMERNYKIDDMNELLRALQEKFEGFSINDYGYQTDYGFILSFPKLQIEGYKGVKMKRIFQLSAAPEDEND